MLLKLKKKRSLKINEQLKFAIFLLACDPPEVHNLLAATNFLIVLIPGD